MKCNTCGADWGQTNDVEPEDSTWDSLSTYYFNIYPDCLVIITNAPPAAFRRAVDIMGKSHEEGEPKNIESILQDLGYVALAASRDNPIEITF